MAGAGLGGCQEGCPCSLPCTQNYLFNTSYAAAAGEQVQREFAVGYRGECGEMRILLHAGHCAHGHLPRCLRC